MGNTRLYMYFQDLPLLGPIASKALIDKVYYIYEVCSVFLEACEEAIEKFEHAKTLHENMKQAVLEEAEDNIDLAAQYVAELEQNYPQIIEIVHTTRAATMLVKHKQKKLKEIYQEGIIDEEECKEIQKAIDQRMVAIQEKTFVITEGIKSS